MFVLNNSVVPVTVTLSTSTLSAKRLVVAINSVFNVVVVTFSTFTSVPLTTMAYFQIKVTCFFTCLANINFLKATNTMNVVGSKINVLVN